MTDNRISRAVEKARARLEQLTPEQRRNIDGSLDIDATEHFEYQTAQARAHAEGKLRTDEAQIVYAALGEFQTAENGGWTNGTDTATKYVVTATIGELLAARIRQARAA